MNTLAWSDTALFTIPALADAPTGSSIASKVPPWWRMSKVAAQFYNAMGRGDHRRSEMLGGSPRTHRRSSQRHRRALQRRQRVHPERQAPRLSLPHQLRTRRRGACRVRQVLLPVPRDIRAGPGHLPQPRRSSRHDPDGRQRLAGGTTPYYGSALVDWYNQSWYGQVGHYAPQNGYIAPPLDGVWATAPYLHDGSVPDVATLLNSTKRPTYWSRMDHDSTHYDQATLGFPWVAQSSGQANPPKADASSSIHDTTTRRRQHRTHVWRRAHRRRADRRHRVSQDTLEPLRSDRAVWTISVGSVDGWSRKMIDWSETQLSIRDATRRFVEKELVPSIKEIEHGGAPPYDALRKMVRAFGLKSSPRAVLRGTSRRRSRRPAAQLHGSRRGGRGRVEPIRPRCGSFRSSSSRATARAW